MKYPGAKGVEEEQSLHHAFFDYFPTCLLTPLAKEDHGTAIEQRVWCPIVLKAMN